MFNFFRKEKAVPESTTSTVVSFPQKSLPADAMFFIGKEYYLFADEDGQPQRSDYRADFSPMFETQASERIRRMGTPFEQACFVVGCEEEFGDRIREVEALIKSSLATAIENGVKDWDLDVEDAEFYYDNKAIFDVLVANLGYYYQQATADVEYEFEQDADFDDQPKEKSFYQTREWKSLRYRALKERGNSCECCGRSPKDGIKIHVDHIKPRSLYPHLALEITNLQILCDECNIAKSNTDETDWR